MSDSNSGESCSAALDTAINEVALSKAEDACGSVEAIKRHLARQLGLVGSADEEPDADCSAAMLEGLDEETLSSFRGTRQWVFCKAHSLIEGEGMDMSEALTAAWDEVDEARAEQGLEESGER